VVTRARKVPVGYKATHAEYVKYVRPSTPCTAAHMTFNGNCTNCGYKSDSRVPTLTDAQILCENCDLLNRLLAEKEARIFELGKIQTQMRQALNAAKAVLLTLADEGTTERDFAIIIENLQGPGSMLLQIDNAIEASKP